MQLRRFDRTSDISNLFSCLQDCPDLNRLLIEAILIVRDSRFNTLTMKSLTLTHFAIFGTLFTSLAAQSSESDVSQAGVRFGIDAESEVELASYELFVQFNTEWSWDLNDRLRLDVDIETAIGNLFGEGENALYGRVAPVAEIYYGESPFTITLSSGPTLYSQNVFNTYDLGGKFHFTSSVGLNWNINKAWCIGYRFQHTSNAHIKEKNPGLEMHTVSIAYPF